MRNPQIPIAGKTLKQLVDRLVSDSLNDNLRSSNRVVNEVPDSLCIMVDECKEGPVISELLATVLTNAKNGDIHISADQFHDIVTLAIQDRNNYNGYALASRLKTIEPGAHQVGGSISIRGQQQLVATVSFSFPLLTIQGNTPPSSGYYHAAA